MKTISVSRALLWNTIVMVVGIKIADAGLFGSSFSSGSGGKKQNVPPGSIRHKPTIAEIYSGDHFDDLVLKVAGLDVRQVNHPTLLIMYEPSCKGRMQSLGVSLAALAQMKIQLPPAEYMYVLWHDYVTFPKHIWYSEYEEDLLKSRFPVQECPTALYFEKGSSPDIPSDVWTADIGVQFHIWVWNKVAHPVTFRNNYNKDVTVTIKDPLHKLLQPYTIELKGGAEYTITSFKSRHAYVTKVITGRPISFYILDDNPTVVINKFVGNVSELTEERKEQEMVKRKGYENHMNKHAERYLLNFKQPLFLPRYSDSSSQTGYKIEEMPIPSYRAMLDYYNRRNYKKRQDAWDPDSTCLNNDVFPTYTVILINDVIKRVAKKVRPLVEKWCHCNLAVAETVGIREYSKNNIVRRHVSNMKSRVITAEMHIYQNLSFARDWRLEMTDVQGERSNLTLLPGQMLMYESANVIVGRPEPFQGAAYASVYMYFRPAIKGWQYYGPIQRILTGPNRGIRLHPLDEPKEFWAARTNILEKKPLHDEL